MADLPLVCRLYDRLAGEDIHLVKLIERMLAFDVRKRLDCNDALEDPFFDVEYPSTDEDSLNLEPAPDSSEEPTTSAEEERPRTFFGNMSACVPGDMSASVHGDVLIPDDPELQLREEVVSGDEDYAAVGDISPDSHGLSPLSIDRRGFRARLASCVFEDPDQLQYFRNENSQTERAFRRAAEERRGNTANRVGISRKVLPEIGEVEERNRKSPVSPSMEWEERRNDALLRENSLRPVQMRGQTRKRKLY